jgi:hypothetical protein
MESKISLLILKNKAKLEKLIESEAPYEKILHQSQLLDKYIIKQIIAMNKIES